MALVSEDSAGEIAIALSLSTNKFNNKNARVWIYHSLMHLNHPRDAA